MNYLGFFGNKRCSYHFRGHCHSVNRCQEGKIGREFLFSVQNVASCQSQKWVASGSYMFKIPLGCVDCHVALMTAGLSFLLGMYGLLFEGFA